MAEATEIKDAVKETLREFVAGGRVDALADSLESVREIFG